MLARLFAALLPSPFGFGKVPPKRFAQADAAALEIPSVAAAHARRGAKRAKGDEGFFIALF